MECIEPNLNVSLESEKRGHITMKVDITPDNLTQEHKFIFEIDQSYLPALIEECHKVLERWPIVGKP